jgi:hypothetical protein
MLNYVQVGRCPSSSQRQRAWRHCIKVSDGNLGCDEVAMRLQALMALPQPAAWKCDHTAAREAAGMLPKLRLSSS